MSTNGKAEYRQIFDEIIYMSIRVEPDEKDRRNYACTIPILGDYPKH